MKEYLKIPIYYYERERDNTYVLDEEEMERELERQIETLKKEIKKE